MLRGVKTQEGKLKAGPKIRSIVKLHGLNLNDHSYPMTREFDLIFCRNVLIYFKDETRREVVDRLLDHLSPAGYLFLGHAESLNGVTDRVEVHAPTVYKLK